MSFIHSSTFAYIKNVIIGVGASVVLVGALFKIQSWPFASEMLTAGLITEALLFLMLGLLPPHKEYYWEKLYPGLDDFNAETQPMGGGSGGGDNKMLDAIKEISIDTKPMEKQQALMVKELQTMARSMEGLQAFQNADFTKVGELTQNAGKFASSLNEAIESISTSLEDTKVYKEELGKLNQNLQSLNQVYGGVLAAMKG